MYMRHWLQSPSSLTHGNIIKRETFSKNTGDAAAKEGAILRYVDGFSRCYLEPRIASVPTTLDDRQLIFYVVDGTGVFEAGDLKQQIGEGDAILVPPGLTHVLNNLENAPLEFLMLEEVVPDDVEALRKAALIRNYRERPLGQGHWTHLVHPIFGPDDGLVVLHSVLVVRIEAMQTPDTHGHGPDRDEVWYLKATASMSSAGMFIDRCPAMLFLWLPRIQGIASSMTQMNLSRLFTLPGMIDRRDNHV